ncbi:MAG: DUF4783 domain-containing protein [Tannerella sp.]|jgi:hypothetical protein|nr:DUF4783 domain-containing protein [Tannerella sp.]
MKKYVLVLALMSVSGLYAADITIISNAFASGSMVSLAANMDTEIDFALQGKAQKMNGAQAIAQLTRFVETNKPAGFTVAHHADKKETGFLVGKLATDNGEFRVNVTYAVKNDKIIIQSIRIE